MFNIFLTAFQAHSTLFKSYFLVISFCIIVLSFNLILKRESQTWEKNLFLTCICYKNQSKYNFECADIDTNNLSDFIQHCKTIYILRNVPPELTYSQCLIHTEVGLTLANKKIPYSK